MSQNVERPNRDHYFMGIAIAVRERADCKGQKVGAVIVVEDRIISTGYNGTPEKMVNCSDGGCVRCENRGKVYESGTAYDLCICVHAEQNAIISAARFGISVQGARVYSTTQPCFGCLKEMLQAKIRQVHYIHPWTSPRTPEQERQYKRLMEEFGCGVVRLEMDDPRKDWALAAGKAASKVSMNTGWNHSRLGVDMRKSAVSHLVLSATHYYATMDTFYA
ncbi:MAG: CMP deaminase [Acidobacteria bacterium]|nr:MAG: CMP deaminase [Acidobacteriota bacterium]